MADDISLTVSGGANRLTASSGSKWEPALGYSRAVRVGATIAVTGTVGISADGTFPAGVEAQSRRSLAIILAAIEALGGKPEHVIRTRIYLTDVTKWQEVAAAHGEVFGDIRPATTLVEVARLIDDAALVEIEADAIVA